jgi:hypothetical protein
LMVLVKEKCLEWTRFTSLPKQRYFSYLRWLISLYSSHSRINCRGLCLLHVHFTRLWPDWF